MLCSCLCLHLLEGSIGVVNFFFWLFLWLLLHLWLVYFIWILYNLFLLLLRGLCLVQFIWILYNLFLLLRGLWLLVDIVRISYHALLLKVLLLRLLRLLDSKPIIISLWSLAVLRYLNLVHLLSIGCMTVLVLLVKLDLLRHARVNVMPISYRKV